MIDFSCESVDSVHQLLAIELADDVEAVVLRHD
jgi:hypothetical protein